MITCEKENGNYSFRFPFLLSLRGNGGGARGWAEEGGRARCGSEIYCSWNCFVTGKICSATARGLCMKENVRQS